MFKKLDVIGDEIFINAMKSSGNVKVLVSEEQEDLIIFPGVVVMLFALIQLMVRPILMLVFQLVPFLVYTGSQRTPWIN